MRARDVSRAPERESDEIVPEPTRGPASAIGQRDRARAIGSAWWQRDPGQGDRGQGRDPRTAPGLGSEGQPAGPAGRPGPGHGSGVDRPTAQSGARSASRAGASAGARGVTGRFGAAHCGLGVRRAGSECRGAAGRLPGAAPVPGSAAHMARARRAHRAPPGAGRARRSRSTPTPRAMAAPDADPRRAPRPERRSCRGCPCPEDRRPGTSGRPRAAPQPRTPPELSQPRTRQPGLGSETAPAGQRPRWSDRRWSPTPLVRAAGAGRRRTRRRRSCPGAGRGGTRRRNQSPGTPGPGRRRTPPGASGRPG